MAENLFLKNAHEKGLIDDREIAFMADIACTNGNQGRAYGFLNGTVLSFYEVRGMTEIGAPVETIDLKEAEFIKGSSFVLRTYLKFRCHGETYTMQGFTQAKKVMAAIQEACK